MKRSNIPEGCKPFNLQEALEGKPVVTRDGRKVKIAGYNPEALHKTEVIVGWAEGVYECWNEHGSYNVNRECPEDLFMAPETKDVWVIIYEHCGTLLSHAAHTENEVKKVSLKMPLDYIVLGIHKITITL